MNRSLAFWVITFGAIMACVGTMGIGIGDTRLDGILGGIFGAALGVIGGYLYVVGFVSRHPIPPYAKPQLKRNEQMKPKPSQSDG
jgi:hypothetical protein